MRDLAEVLAGWIYALQITSGQQWVLRLTVLSSGVGAAVLCNLWFPVLISPALLVTALVMAFASVIRPDSVAPLFFVAAVGLWWLAGAAAASQPDGGGGTPGRWLGVTVLVAVFHLSTAFAAAAPSYARVTGRAAKLLSLAGVGYVAVSVAVGMAVLGLAALPRHVLGPGWVVAGALSVSVATVALVAALRPRRAH
ncbi:hypothetical protein [Tessaracoccus antarcticus]|uniref:Uncharacterized protein n=1 Tax=Tessaracoccus antarcticus TaxID=2479848 RepID=A0A3M0G4D0_9ACTN|nr:hypothetical protein [Tessaracoccus antarcticus]RMB59861.1 hypothetical protein EAX62_08965 [Tessaracoccus antarcticus]